MYDIFYITFWFSYMYFKNTVCEILNLFKKIYRLLFYSQENISFIISSVLHETSNKYGIQLLFLISYVYEDENTCGYLYFFIFISSYTIINHFPFKAKSGLCLPKIFDVLSYTIHYCSTTHFLFSSFVPQMALLLDLVLVHPFCLTHYFFL